MLSLFFFPTDLAVSNPITLSRCQEEDSKEKVGVVFIMVTVAPLLESLTVVGINIFPDISECLGILVQFLFKHAPYLSIRNVTMYDMNYKNKSCI